MSDPQIIQALLAGRSLQPTVSTEGGDKSRIRELAAQFESMLLTQMLKDLRSSIFDSDDKDSDSGFQSGSLGDVMNSELGLALSKAGGFGLGKALADAMLRQTEVNTPTAMAEPALFLTNPMPRASSPFGYRQDPIDGDTRFHKGIDVPMSVGSEVRAPVDGRVLSVGKEDGYGLTVVVDHGNGIRSRYAHLSGANVHVGDAVRSGEIVARSGNSGRSTGPHLHFELTAEGRAVDPQAWLGAVVARPGAKQ